MQITIPKIQHKNINNAVKQSRIKGHNRIDMIKETKAFTMGAH